MALIEGNLCHLAPQRPRLDIEQVVAIRADRIQSARLDEDAAFHLSLAVQRMPLAAHCDLAATFVRICNDANDILNRLRPENRDRRTANTTSDISAGDIPSVLVE